ncbi:hypothetical protein KQ229_00920 [Lactobacillus helveticus]|uniref:Integral membrane protein n=2 Tax=Lactobacillus helveticus TaxID=1587 RepID=U6F4F8_LACHE|nr:hypothetical protein [Lactobacillus helveticus]ANZ55490.1 hypothetical protein BCM45_02580 [Lactobacillus helveticus]AQY53594.1 hypothetical protein BCM44_05770 [Lactobacillus helveticus]MBU6033782.1 hypothetical protein [Lactobacillus helveticus]MBW1219353.1 hypothetical protein [Lactobacillus helveticus]MDY0876162.1 hypothetical protein [Lactobacillus helveticus]
MRVTKLVIGILMIVLSIWLFLDGLLGQLLGIYATKSIFGGILEIVIAGLFIGAGIVYICLEKSPYLGGDITGDITGLILMIIAGILGIFGGFIYAWMFLYAAIALIIGFGFYIWHRIIGTDD